MFHGFYAGERRFLDLTETDIYKYYGIPICVFAYNSRLHENILDKYIEIANKYMIPYNEDDYALFWIIDSKNFQEKMEPTIWIRDKFTGLDIKFKFSETKLINILEKIKYRAQLNVKTQDSVLEPVKAKRGRPKADIAKYEQAIIQELNKQPNITMGLRKIIKGANSYFYSALKKLRDEKKITRTKNGWVLNKKN